MFSSFACMFEICRAKKKKKNGVTSTGLTPFSLNRRSHIFSSQIFGFIFLLWLFVAPRSKRKQKLPFRNFHSVKYYKLLSHFIVLYVYKINSTFNSQTFKPWPR